MDRQNEIVRFLRSGNHSVQEIDEVLAGLTEDELNEPIECLIIQRRFIEAAHQRAAFVVDAPGTYFPNPKDRETQIKLRASQEIAMAFCNVKDACGSQLGNTVDELAQRCLDAECGSKKQSQLIDDLRDEIHDLGLEVVRRKAART